MNITNPWVGYADRSYQQIKNKILNWRLPQAAPELTDRSEGNPFMVLVDMFSGLTEMINYSIDSANRERFIGTAQEYKSMVNLVKALDYRIKSNLPESVNLLFTLSAISTVDVLIPIGTICVGPNGNFRTTADLVIQAGDINGEVGAKQWDLQSGLLVGVTTGTMNQRIYLGNKYVHKSAQIFIGDDIYQEVDTFAYSKSSDPHFIVEVDELRESWAVLGDGVSGKLPVQGTSIYLSLYTTNHVLGTAPMGSINSIQSVVPMPNGITLSVNNPIQSSGGAPTESIEQIRKNAPLGLRTLGRAVTYDDHLELLLSVPGIGKGSVDPTCGGVTTMFIAPISNQGGGDNIASKALIQDTLDFMESKKLLGRVNYVYAAGSSKLKLDITVTPAYRQDFLRTSELVRQTLLDNYGYDNSLINRKIRLSDLYALVDNLSPVDFMNINSLSLVPYPSPNGHGTQLNWDIEIQPTSILKANYAVTLVGNSFLISRNGVFITSKLLYEVYEDSNIKFFIKEPTVGSYTTGQGWKFSSYPYNRDLEVADNSIPVLLSDNLSIEIAKPLEVTTIKCK